jgi:hypothetical protein
VLTINFTENQARSLPASEQFSTKSCVRCAGLLVTEWSYDLQNPGRHNVEALRCVQCGNRIDPVILRNQIRLSVERQSRRQIQHTDFMRIVLLANVANPPAPVVKGGWDAG